MQGYVYSSFCLCPGHRNSIEEKKTFPAMDSLVYGEANGPNFITVEDCMIICLSTCRFFLYSHRTFF